MMPRADWVKPQEHKPMTPEQLAEMLQSVAEHDELVERYRRVCEYWERNVLPAKKAAPFRSATVQQLSPRTRLAKR